MNTRHLRSLSAACLLIVIPRAASAQFESFLEKVNDLNFFLSCWQVRGEAEKKGDCPKGKNGYGLELSFDVGNLKLGKREDTTAADWKPEKREVITENRTTRTVVTSTYVKESVFPRRYLQTEVALGYSQFSGFESGNRDFDLGGTVRELPSVAVYGTYISEDFKLPLDISPYVGLKSGLIELSNVQALQIGTADTVITYSATARAFQFGGVYGAVLGLGERLHLFVERAHQIRKFPHVQWAGPVAGKIVNGLPRSLDFSGPTISVGLQITIKPKE